MHSDADGHEDEEQIEGTEEQYVLDHAQKSYRNIRILRSRLSLFAGLGRRGRRGRGCITERWQHAILRRMGRDAVGVFGSASFALRCLLQTCSVVRFCTRPGANAILKTP